MGRAVRLISGTETREPAPGWWVSTALDICRHTMYREPLYGPPARQLLRARFAPGRTPAWLCHRRAGGGALGGRGAAHCRDALRRARAHDRARARPGRPRGDRGGEAAALLPALRPRT